MNSSHLRKGSLILIIFNSVYILLFILIYLLSMNFEFLLYSISMAVLFIIILIILSKSKLKLPSYLLWLLSFAGLLHMCGGEIKINGLKLYQVNLFHIVGSGDSFILRTDQVAHFFGMFLITLLAYYILVIYFENNKSYIFYIVAFFIGIGWGALVEVQEFLTVMLFEKTGVGGYFNNEIDLIFNLLGALSACVFLYIQDLILRR